MTAGKFRLLFNYHKDIQGLNLLFSFFIALAIHATGWDLLTSFILSLVTGGYFLASYVYERRRKHEYYFYYNKGFSRVSLITYSYLLNGLLASLILIVKSIIQ